ncbi:MAG: FtsB family cell division protein [Nocardioides sp.]
MPGTRPSTRSPRPRAQSRPRPANRAGTRPGGPRPRAQAASSALPSRPRLTSRAAVLVLVLAVLMVSYASSMRAYFEQRHHLDALQADIDESRGNIKALKREKERWDDPAYVRAQARQRFGWVLPGDIAFQVIGEDGKPLDHDDSLSDPEAVTDAARPLWWQSAWRSVEVAGNPPDKSDEPQPADLIRAPKHADRSGQR